MTQLPMFNMLSGVRRKELSTLAAAEATKLALAALDPEEYGLWRGLTDNGSRKTGLDADQADQLVALEEKIRKAAAPRFDA